MKEKVSSSRSGSIIERWENLILEIEDMQFSSEDFKQLFVDTWDYFVDVLSSDSNGSKYIKRKDLEIVTLMAKVLGVSYYPDDEKPYEFDTARQFIEGFLNSLANEDYDLSRNITIPYDAESHESTVERVSFDESFDKEIKINMEQYEE